MTTDTPTKTKTRSKRTTVPAPETGAAASPAIDALTGGDAPRIVMIPVERVHPHPRNPRTDVGDVSELAADIAAHGVDQPATVVPHPEIPGDYYAVIGHRRRAATLAAGLTALPAVIRDDLTPEQQHKMMVRENVHRSDLTVVEEADAYQAMLEIDGLSVEEIATGVSRSATTVRERLKVAKLPAPAREALHTHAATLTDARALDEFDDDPAVRDRIAQHLGTGDFRFQLQAERSRREVLVIFAPLVDKLTAAGIPEIDPGSATPEGCTRAAHVTRSSMGMPATGMRERDAWFTPGPDALAILDDAAAGWSWLVRHGELYVYRPFTLEEITEREESAARQAALEADRAAAAEQTRARAEEFARQAEERQRRAAERSEVAKVASAAHEPFLREVLARKMTAANTAAVADGVAAIAVESAWDEGSFLYAEPDDVAGWVGVDLEAVGAEAVGGADTGPYEDAALEAGRAAVRTALAALDPGRRLLVVAAATCEPISAATTDLPTRRLWYALLEQLGYVPSEQERAVLIPPADAAEAS